MALTPAELARYINDASVARWPTVAELGCSPAERAATRGARRSIYAGANGLKAGQEIGYDDVTVLRPCQGGDVLDASQWDTVMGSDAAADVEPYAPLRYGDLHHRSQLFP
jgi:sialic acid synthase SpsE